MLSLHLISFLFLPSLIVATSIEPPSDAKELRHRLRDFTTWFEEQFHNHAPLKIEPKLSGVSRVGLFVRGDVILDAEAVYINPNASRMISKEVIFGDPRLKKIFHVFFNENSMKATMHWNSLLDL